jgi:phage terminase large subunit GpA-like protein
LLAEKPIRKKVGNNFKRVWVKPAFARNEALDARVYAFAALHALKSYGFNLDREVDRVAALASKPSAPKKTMSDFGKLNT